MKENFLLLRNKFNEIKKLGFIPQLRKGTTGLGYTFETLLGKTEDSESKPDFNGIEIKTKLGYTKSPVTLFNCIPKRNNVSAINYIIDNFSWKNESNTLIFSKEIYSKHNLKNSKINIKIDYLGRKINMIYKKDNNKFETICYWDFKDLQEKLFLKLNYLAIIHGYPYKINNKIYYKYVKMTSYKLLGFFEFLKLIDEDKILVAFYIKKYKNDVIENHGVSFRIHNNYISELFKKLPY